MSLMRFSAIKASKVVQGPQPKLPVRACKMERVLNANNLSQTKM